MTLIFTTLKIETIKLHQKLLQNEGKSSNCPSHKVSHVWISSIIQARVAAMVGWSRSLREAFNPTWQHWIQGNGNSWPNPSTQPESGTVICIWRINKWKVAKKTFKFYGFSTLHLEYNNIRVEVYGIMRKTHPRRRLIPKDAVQALSPKIAGKLSLLKNSSTPECKNRRVL